jgi:hypothetical protein
MAKLNKLGVKNSLWNNIRAKRGSGKKPTKEMLAQERKIKSEQSAYGGYIEVNPFLEQYDLGGFIGKGLNAGTGANAMGMAGSMLSGLIPTTKKDGTTSIGGSTAQGALKGFSAGAALGPIGMIGGAAIGGLTSLLQAKQQQEAEQEALLAKQNETSRNTLANMQYGVANASNLPMAMGGYTNDPPNKNKQQNNGITFRDINDNPFVQTAKIFDPTGFSSYPDVYFAGEDLYNDPSWANAGNLGVNLFGALPMIGKLATPAKIAKIAAKTTSKATGISKGVNSVIDTAPELIPFLRKPTESVQNFTSKYITSPLTNINPGGRSYKVDQINNVNNKVDRVNLANNLSDLYSVGESIPRKSEQYNMGGSINPIGQVPVGDFSNFAAGGTHEQNPYGGIPQGYNSQGKLRTVEQDESAFKFNDGKYIFSNRLTFE